MFDEDENRNIRRVETPIDYSVELYNTGKIPELYDIGKILKLRDVGKILELYNIRKILKLRNIRIKP